MIHRLKTFVSPSGLVLLCLAILFAIVQIRQMHSPTSSEIKHIIRYSQDGFSPSVLTIRKGDTISFHNESSEAFWPASDLHPTHAIYKEFDPQEPINPEGVWNFDFGKTGSWNYHDHLSPRFTGKIIVLEENEIEAASVNCIHSPNHGEKCWNSILSTAIEKGGAKGGLTALSYLFKNDSTFKDSGCHKYAHIIGEKTLQEYITNKDINSWDFPEEATYCGYGFLHGLFEHLFREKSNIEFTREVCNVIDKKFSDTIPRIRMNCFHGAGHGFVEEPPSWNDAQKIIEQAAPKCESVSETADLTETRECLQGVFNVIVTWQEAGSYGIGNIDPNDPFKLCREQKYREYSSACYYEFSMKIIPLAEDGIEQIASRYVNDVENNETANSIINSAMASIMQNNISKESFTEYVFACHNLQTRLQDACFRAVVGGLMAHGEPGEEYIKAIDFCNDPKLTTTEHDKCFNHLIPNLKRTYPNAKVLEICKGIENKYQELCN